MTEFDVRDEGFVAEARRQSGMAAASTHDLDDQALVDAISEFSSGSNEEL